jgi:ABC-type dipeptide/oligopeptide/nickel transport system permease subunit
MTKEMKWGLRILSLYFLWALCWLIYKYFLKGSLLVPYEPEMKMELELAQPFSHGLILGADLMGRSLLEVLSAGLSYSLLVGIFVTTITASIGLTVGYLAVKANSFFKIFFDLAINLVFIFPSILIAIMIMAFAGQSFKGLVFALIITGWSGYAKISRSETKRVLALSYVEGARAVGMGELRMFFKIIIPAILPIMIVNMVLGISGVIISEAALGFLGLGASPFSWGAMLANSKTVLLEAPFVAILLSLSMAGLIIGLNLFGDGLRDFLDPKEN